MDPFAITPAERERYEQQFLSLNPINGIVTGDQAKGFLLQSQLQPATLGLIWAMADTDVDGKLNINEFSIACKLINLKLRGFTLPKVLPPALAALTAHPPVVPSAAKPPIPPLPSQIPGVPLVPESNAQPMRTGLISPPSGGPSPVIGGAPPIPPLPVLNGSKMGAARPVGAVRPTVPSAIGLPPVVKPMMPLQPMPGTVLPPTPMPMNIPMVPPLTQAPLIPPMTQPVAAVPLISSQSLIGPQSQPVPPSTLSGLSTTHPSPPTPPTPPILAPAVAEQRNSITELGTTVSPLVEWAIPQASKLKYTQLFNSTDKDRSGFITGPQARNILVASKLPRPLLAQIWGLADMDADGKLSCEEFVLALHLCDMVRNGETLPTTLPPHLVPPTLRRVRQNSVGSNSGVESSDPLVGMSQVTFEDKRKENFEKGQAELDRRRKALLEIQRKEQEERERKEREEMEKQEKIRLEQERKRQEEIERELERTRELEKAREEERKRADEQREAARREMERQRQLEWENTRRQELENQRRKEQENVLALKAKSQALAVELSQKEEKVKDLSKQISETRCGVTSIKSIIDGMRQTRDQNMAEYQSLKAVLKQRNNQLVMLSQQKAKLEAQGKLDGKDSADDVLAFNNKTIVVKNLKDKIGTLEEEVNTKIADVENNNTQLDNLRKELKGYLKDCEDLFNAYADKRNKLLDLKGANRLDNAWGDDAWGSAPTTAWPEENEVEKSGYKKYRALYEFVARNGDELSFQPGDTILVPTVQTGEPGWLTGELGGASGWFPESYVEPMDAFGSTEITSAPAVAKTPLEGIAEVGETVSESGSGFGDDSKWGDAVSTQVTQVEVAPVAAAVGALPPEQQEYYTSLYSYASEEPGDLIFDQGETILVVGKDGDWWTGVIGDRTGIFPSNYVSKVETTAVEPVVQPVAEPVKLSPVAAIPSTSPITTSEKAFDSQPVGDRVVTPDFASLAAQVESGSGEESETKGKGKKPVVATVIAPYQATSSEQLSLQRGQLVMIRKKTSTGWWEGELQARGKKRQVGWFPASYVKLLAGGRNSQSQSRKTSESGLSDGLLERVVALYSYAAQNEDELSFEKDDVVTILAKDEPSWWKGECKGSVGLFPSNYVGPICESTSFNFESDFIDSFQAAEASSARNSTSSESGDTRIKVTKEEKRRQQHIKELILTEQAYIDDMSVVHDVFEKPLIESKLLNSEQLRVIFINWHDIIECNHTFLRALRVRREMSKGGIIRTIGDILCENLPRMTVYVRFCSCQLRAASALQQLTETKPEFQVLAKRCQSDPRTQGLPLSSFLIKPMQRITKYPLLISKILENTPADHPDRTNLEEALAKAEELCLQVNEGVREKENSERLEWLQSHVLSSSDSFSEPLIFNSLTNALGPRKFIHFGVLTKTKSGKELVGFLMNDFLLLAQPNRTLGVFNFDRHQNIFFRVYKKPLMLNETTIHNDGNDSPELRLEHNKIIYNLTCSSVNERNLWLRKLTQAQSDMKRLEMDKITRQQSKQASFGAVGRILVMVLSGSKLKPVTVRRRRPKYVMAIVLVNVEGLEPIRKVGREVFCEISMGSQEQRTPPVHMASSTEVVFNSSMQFLVKDLKEDVLCLTVKEKGNFSPDQFLGRSELRVSEIVKGSRLKGSDRRAPVVKQLRLREVHTGCVNLKLDLHLFDQN